MSRTVLFFKLSMKDDVLAFFSPLRLSYHAIVFKKWLNFPGSPESIRGSSMVSAFSVLLEHGFPSTRLQAWAHRFQLTMATKLGEEKRGPALAGACAILFLELLFSLIIYN